MLPSLSILWCQEPDLCFRGDSTCIPSFYACVLTKGQFDAPRWDNLGYAEQPHGSWGAFSVLTSWFMGLIHFTRVFTTYVGDTSHWLCSFVRGIELY
jgi:hypothetical protein